MRCAIITDHNVRDLYAKGFKDVFSFPPGEKHKTRETKAFLEDLLLESGFSKDTVIIGLGGGVVTDMAGFLAATFCRGVPLILIPTTLMAMVDASIGGKNGVNTQIGKNMIGTIYHPCKVITDERFLKTLPEREMKNGEVEILKMGLVAAPTLINSKNILNSVEFKRRIVALDEKETGLRRILNLGHTIGHALETLSLYEIPHGKAVSLGILIECHIAYIMGILKIGDWEIIQGLFPKEEIPYAYEEIIEVLSLDKKSKGREPRFVLLQEIGKPHPFDGEYCAPVPEGILREVLSEYVVCSSLRS